MTTTKTPRLYRDGVCRDCYELSTDEDKPFAGDCRRLPCNCGCHGMYSQLANAWSDCPACGDYHAQHGICENCGEHTDWKYSGGFGRGRMHHRCVGCGGKHGDIA